MDTEGRGTGYVQCDADGGFLHGNASFLDFVDERATRRGAPIELALCPFLDRLEQIEGTENADDADIDNLIAAWGEPGAALRARDEDGGWHFLSSYILPDGGHCYLDIEIPTSESMSPTPSATGSVTTGDYNLQMLGVAVQSLSEGIAAFDENHRLAVFNERYREMNPHIADFIRPGVHWETLVREESRRGVLDAPPDEMNIWFSKLLSFGNRAERMEIEFSDAWLSIVVDPIETGGFVVALSDITKRKRAEETAREADQMLSKVLEACPTNVLMSRIDDGEVIYRSPASAELFGHADTARAYFVDPLARGDYLTELLPTGRVDDFPLICRAADGREFPAVISARIIEYKGEDVIVSSTTDLTEQNRVRDELTSANYRIRDAIESLSEGFALFDSDERLVIANQRFVDLNMPYADLIRPGAGNEELLLAAIEHDHVVDAEQWLADYRVEKKRGDVLTRRRFEFQLSDGTWLSSLRNPTREGGFVLSWLDITVQRNAAEDLQQSNDRLNDAIESLADGFALFDADQKLVRFNSRYAELNEYIVDAIYSGANYSDILNAAVASGQLVKRDEAFIRGRSENLKPDDADERNEIQFNNGSTFVVTRDRTSEGGFVITRRDITRQKRAEAAERESDKMMRRVLEACPVNLVMRRYDNWEIVYRSARALETFGSLASSADYWTNEEDRRRVSELLEEHGSVDDMEVMMNRESGTPIRVAYSGRKIDFRGEPMVVSYAYDLTERIKLEEELAQQRENLHQSEKLSALGELLAGVAHELNNPLSVVVGHALMLKEQAEVPELLHRAEKIGNAAERCARIVKAFLAMARQRPTQLERASVNTLLETAVEIGGYGLQSVGVQLVTNFANDLPQVEVDTDQLIPVFTNLITNAEHALSDMRSRGRLEISTVFDEGENEVVVTISDNGPGVPDALRTRIFEPFFTTKEIGSGTGIGLAFCHRIVEAHNGTICLLSGPGAQFEIRLPAHTAVAMDDCAEQVHPKSQGYNALVIDDEPDVAELIEQILCADGYAVRVAASAEEALDMLPGDFTIVLSDMNLPGLKGSDFLVQVQDRWPELESGLGFITGDTMSSGADSFLRNSGRPYLEKPVTPNELRELARTLVESGKKS